MSEGLRLTIATPESEVVALTGIASLRAMDRSGSFGIRPGHADLLTVLPASVVRWREQEGAERFCAVRGGVLTLTGGNHVAIACREALRSDHLDELEARVAAMREGEDDAGRKARVAAMQLHARAVRQLMRYLTPGSQDSLRTIFRDEAP